ncbi:MAG: alpha/beta fold hydrolase [Streptosporangiales bacterium]|nr:alpha/beta fold hydrolase [Streptosporangiales bacterium]
MLDALGRFCHRHNRLIVIAWLALILVGFGIGSKVFDRLAESDYATPGSESVRGTDLVEDVAGAGERVVVLVDGHDVDDPSLRTAVTEAVGDVRTQPHVLSAVDWYSTRTPSMRSEDGEASLVLVELDNTLSGSAADEAHDLVRERLERLSDEVSGVDVKVGGTTAVFRDFTTQIEHDIRRGELIAFPITLVLLVLVFGGIVAALLPLVGTVGAVAGSLLALLGFTYVIDIDSNAISITTIMGLGLSIDYALLVVSRYREERGHGLDGRAATGRAIAAAGRTVCFSALTVAAALSGMFAFKTPMFHAFALAGISVIVIAALAALTLVPALLGLAGRWIKAPTRPVPDEGFFSRISRGTQKVAPLVAIVVAGLLLFAGSPFLDAKFGGVDHTALPRSSESRIVADAQEDRFPGGGSEPVSVVAEVPRAELGAYGRQTVADLPGVNRVRAGDLGNGVAVLDVYPDDPAAGQTREEAGEKVVRAIWADRPDFAVYVTGSAALLVDLKAEIADRLPWGLAIIGIATFLLLFLMTGSILIPVKALVMDALSLGATFGMLVLVFQEGHLSDLLGFDPPGSLDLFVPILVFAFAFGLSMDYEVFLLSRIKEAYDATGDNKRAVTIGLQRSGRIITSAALLIIVVCAGFVSGELVMIKQMGLAMCVAVAVDATLVRCLLVPATMSLLGRANWWAPRWLRRVHRRIGLHESPPPAGATPSLAAPGLADPAPSDAAAPVVRHVTQQVPTASGRVVPVRMVLRDDDGPVLVFWPALGVAATYYTRFADALADRGISVALPDLPGQGDSTVEPRTASVGYGSLLATDVPDTLAAVRDLLPGRRLLVGGSSIGGQLAVLYAATHPDDVDGIVLVASGTAFFGGFPNVRRRLSVLGLSQFVDLTSRLSGHWPGDRFGFGGAQPAALMRDWARNARTGRYVVDGVDLDPLVARVRVPVLAITMAGDDLAPTSSVDHLCGKLRGARVDRWHHAPDGPAPGHLRWARNPGSVADRIAAWATGSGAVRPHVDASRWS